MSRRGTILVAMSLLAATVVAAPGFAQDERAKKLQSSLDTFCQKWMGFLEQREKDNREKIGWRAIANGVEGEFVGYQKKYECRLSEMRPDTKTPVGTIKYLELKFRHRGASSSQAMQNKPKIIEAVEVTEIFRYSKNKWVY